MTAVFSWQKSLLLVAGICLLSSCRSDSPNHDDQDKVAAVEALRPEKVGIIFSRSCASCHGLDGHGIAGVAPDLRRARARSADEWEKYLRSPQTSHPVSQAPPVWMDADEVKTMAAYLESLSRPNQGSTP